MTLDYRDYAEDLDAIGIAPENHAAYFEALVVILQRFVDIGQNRLASNGEKNPSRNPATAIPLSENFPENITKTWTRHASVGMENHDRRSQ